MLLSPVILVNYQLFYRTKSRFETLLQEKKMKRKLNNTFLTGCRKQIVLLNAKQFMPFAVSPPNSLRSFIVPLTLSANLNS
jgi:hypothetical protein